MGSQAAGMAATWAAGLAALLVEGLTGGSNPCGKQFGSGTSRVKYNFSLAKIIAGSGLASPDTPRALTLHHTITLRHALSLSCSTPLGRLTCDGPVLSTMAQNLGKHDTTA